MKFKLLSCAGALLCGLVFSGEAAEPDWNPSAIQACDRACLANVLDGYMNAIFRHDPKAVPPLAIDYRMIENTGQIDVGGRLMAREGGTDQL